MQRITDHVKKQKPLNRHWACTIRASFDLTTPTMAGEQTSIRRLDSSISDLSLVEKVGHTYCSAMQSARTNQYLQSTNRILAALPPRVHRTAEEQK
jgi:hypothetical protein